MVNALHGVSIFNTNLFVSILGALFRDVLEALLMDVLHVVPPSWLISLILKLRVKTDLSQVLHNNVVAFNKRASVEVSVRSAVLAVAEALILLKVLSAGWASPGNEPWVKVHRSVKLVTVLIKFFDEVKSKHIV